MLAMACPVFRSFASLVQTAKKNSQLPNVHSSNLIGSAKQRSRRVHFNEYARQRPYVDLCRVLNAQ
jgi:aminoglycoside phosphotransferase